MILALTLLSSMAWSAEFDFRDPSFWSKSYQIPESYCVRDVSLVTDTPINLLHAAPPCVFELTRNGVFVSQCELSSEKADKMVASLQKRKEFNAYSNQCQPIPELPELYYKLAHLRKESESLRKSGIQLPGIFGLLEAQLSALERLIAAHEAAKMTLMRLSIRPTDKKGFVTFVSRRLRQIPSSDSPPPWTRSRFDFCDQVEILGVIFSQRSENDKQRLKAALMTLGAPIDTSLCGQERTVAMFHSASSDSAIREALMGFDGLLSWRIFDRRRPHEEVVDDERFDALSRDLEHGKAALSKAPHVVALANAELARVAETARILKPLRQGRVIRLEFR